MYLLFRSLVSYSSSASTSEQVSKTYLLRLALADFENPGVILSTAFCHLLGDAFKALDKPPVREHYGRIGKWTGLIMYLVQVHIFADADILCVVSPRY